VEPVVPRPPKDELQTPTMVFLVADQLLIFDRVAQTITVLVNGGKQVQSITIDPEVVSKEDVGMLQDLIVAAINDAHRKADEAMAQTMGGMLPPGMKLPGM